jgi:hypothetical protein
MMLANPLPDETLYGLVARSGRMRGDTLGTDTSRALFGHPDAGLHHDFLHNLECFATNTQGLLGSAHSISERLTVAPYFLRFKPPAVQIRMQEVMAGTSASQLKHLLGLPPSLCRARSPLSACPRCIEEDRAKHGIASWRRMHQLPGSLLCSVHATPLLKSSLRINRLGKSQYLLPEDPGIFRHDAKTQEWADTACLVRLAKLNTQFLESKLPLPYTREGMAAAYHHGLKAHGLLTPGGLVRAETYLQWLHSHFRHLRSTEPFRHALAPPHETTLLRLVRKPRADFHPLYHLLLIDALFDGWDAFVEVYAWESEMGPAPEAAHESKIVVPAQIAEFITDLRQPNQHSTIGCLANQYALDISTAMRWAGKLGAADIRRRPKVLHHALKSEVVVALLRGEPQRDVAKRTGLSRATIDRVCQEQPGRHAAWQAANKEWKRTKARTDLLAYLADHPGTTLSDARDESPPGYCWLRRHDAVWLRSVIPEKVRTAPVCRSRPRPFVDWAARDALCFAQLCQLAATITLESRERLKPGTVLRKLPPLPFLPRLDRLPKSRALVDEILKEHVAKRRSGRK